MQTYSTQVQVEAEHIDKGNHANWIAQLLIAEKAHFDFRNQLGIGLEQLQEKYRLFFVISNIKDISYLRQLRLGDVLDVRIIVWIYRPTGLKFHFHFYKYKKLVTEISWVMPLISLETECPVKIPSWIIEVIGPEKPNALDLKPASTCT